ncbi:Gfo/Idh/MocA family protein [Vagococcus salmoninarum]|uniref:Gfo/Idh/MocA family protein n=1 Tax=Vagococcus salmoninarum TaxID=2739 RepID=UPI003F943B91
MKIGVMGLGNIAQKAYIPVMNELRSEVEWHFYSRQANKVAELGKNFNWEFTYSNWEGFLASGLDACFIHTPTATHGKLIRELLLAGIHVFVDKPVSDDFQEVSELHELASSKNLILMTGFNRRFAPMNQQLKNVPGKNLIIAQKNRMATKAPVKFEIFDMLIHVVDTTLYLLDEEEITSVSYSLHANQAGHLRRGMITFETAETTAIASINMEAGAHTETVEVQALAGTYLVENLDTLTKKEQGVNTIESFSDWENTLTKRGFKDLILGFIEAVETKTESDINSSHSSLMTHYYIDQLYQYYLSQPTE